MYFVLQELTSQFVMLGADLYVWRVSGVASNKWNSSWTEACYWGHVEQVESLLDRGMLLRSRRSSGVPPGFDFIECFTTTFLRAHSWLNWVGVPPGQRHVTGVTSI